MLSDSAEGGGKADRAEALFQSRSKFFMFFFIHPISVIAMAFCCAHGLSITACFFVFFCFVFHNKVYSIVELILS